MSLESYRQHQERRHELHRLSRRYTLFLSAVVGIFAGFLAVIFRVLVAHTEEIRGTWSKAMWDAHPIAGAVLIISFCASLGGLSAWMTGHYCKEAGGSGIPYVKAVLISARTLRPVRTIWVKLLGGLLALASGMSLGREGPTVHLGACCAALYGNIAKLSGRTRRALVAAGAGAGLAAAFNAPLAGFLFIMEELRRDMSRVTYGNALVTAVTSVAVTRFCLGSQSTFHLDDFSPMPISTLPIVALVGIIATFVGIGFNKLIGGISSFRKKFNPPSFVAGGSIGALAGILLMFLPEVTGGGNELTQRLLSGEFSHPHLIAVLATLLVVKLVFTVISYATGVPGGIFAPLLTMGALLGTLLGTLCKLGIPDLTPEPARLATIGMAAVLAASVRAPLTGVVLVMEMTGRYHLLYSLLLASFVAYALAESTHDEPIYEALLRQELQHGRAGVQEEARVLEIGVEPGSRFDRERIDHLTIPEDLLIAILDRESRMLVPHGNTQLQAGDYITVVAGPRCGDTELSEFLDSTRTP